MKVSVPFTLAAVLSAYLILYENLLTGFTPSQYWHATGVFWRSGPAFFRVIATLACLPYAYLAAMALVLLLRPAFAGRRA